MTPEEIRATATLALEAHIPGKSRVDNIAQAITEAVAENDKQWVGVVKALTDFNVSAVAEEREACCQTIRNDCQMCDRGHSPDSTHEEPVECQYCGVPIAAIRARSDHAISQR